MFNPFVLQDRHAKGVVFVNPNVEPSNVVDLDRITKIGFQTKTDEGNLVVCVCGVLINSHSDGNCRGHTKIASIFMCGSVVALPVSGI